MESKALQLHNERGSTRWRTPFAQATAASAISDAVIVSDSRETRKATSECQGAGQHHRTSGGNVGDRVRRHHGWPRGRQRRWISQASAGEGSDENDVGGHDGSAENLDERDRIARGEDEIEKAAFAAPTNPSNEDVSRAADVKGFPNRSAAWCGAEA